MMKKKNMLTKWLAVVLALVMVLALSACGDKAEEATPDAAEQQTEEPETQEQTVACADELTALLDRIVKEIPVGTAGSSLQQTKAAAELLDFCADKALTKEDAVQVTLDWIAGKTAEEQVSITEVLGPVGACAQELQGSAAADLLESAGYEGEGYPWDVSAVEAVTAIVESAGAL